MTDDDDDVPEPQIVRHAGLWAIAVIAILLLSYTALIKCALIAIGPIVPH